MPSWPVAPYNAAFAETMGMVKDFYNIPEYGELLPAAQAALSTYVVEGKGTAQEALDAIAAEHDEDLQAVRLPQVAGVPADKPGLLAGTGFVGGLSEHGAAAHVPPPDSTGSAGPPVGRCTVTAPYHWISCTHSPAWLAAKEACRMGPIPFRSHRAPAVCYACSPATR